ncbi:hypothetical protein KCP75_20480 [Salmonella enterica subsp. enterica]|nr:hypothetical protein KCP75_20480 [Salmonella enterica subsp. enterica]
MSWISCWRGKIEKSKSHSFARWRCAYRYYHRYECRPDDVSAIRHSVTRNLPARVLSTIPATAPNR